MKTLIALLFALSLCYLLPNPTHSTFNPLRLHTADVAVASDNTPVLDTDGNELRVGETYYITIPFAVPVGVQLAWLNSTTQCASNVVILSRCLADGDPIRITPADPTATVVSPSTPLSFSFSVSTSPRCASSVNWGIMHDPRFDLYFLNSGEFVPNVSDRFKIEANPDPDHPNTYRIAYCQFGGDKCYYLGGFIISADAALRIGLTSTYPFPFMFRRAPSCNDALNITEVTQGVGSWAEKFGVSVL
ncbi:sporamin B-like [Ipomoea triloba]|uniref:sporamin B-like n=1 Tax=Ipomoea triloba TaxID=35885 RepID=UPI00125DC0B8|nr:sporamin B-like [Ipomoea triloba]